MMTHVAFVLARLMIAFALLLCAFGAKTEKQRLSVLIVDGINNHDWETGTRAVKAILNATGRFTV